MAATKSLVVLDASAIMALIYGEPGARQVARVLNRAALSTVTLAELVGFLTALGWAKAEIDRALSVRCRLADFDAATARIAGDLASTRRDKDPSFEARACVATALALGAKEVWTADRRFAAHKMTPLKIIQIHD